MPRLAFSTDPFIEQLGSLNVFLPRRDAVLMHLAHPLMRRALSVLARRRYPGDHQVSRWTVRRGAVPDDADAVVLVSIEELAVNELRETFHRWIRTLVFPVRNGELGDPRAQLDADGAAARRSEDERYRQRQGEVSALIAQSTITRLEREIEELNLRAAQGVLFDGAGRVAAIEQSIEEKREEIRRRRQHYVEIRDQLQHERTRLIDYLLPKRFAMTGEARVFPVTAEVRLPERPR